MKNKLGDLDNHLFAQLERLGDETLDADEIEAEAKRAQAMVGVADKIVENSKVKLSAAKLFAEHGQTVVPMLPQISKTES